MEISFFLAKVLGWYLIISGLYLLSRQTLVRSVLKDILSQRALLFLFGLITLLLGLLLVVSHNIWVMAWPVVITVLAWITLIIGILRLFYPELIIRMGNSMLNRQYSLAISGLFSIVIGLFLLFKTHSLLLITY